MQSFNGYSPNGDAGAMPPPPSNMGGMNTGPTRTNHQQQYQAQMRSNNQQHLPPSSPGYIQSPPNFNTPTPPGSVSQQHPYGQPLQSPTKPPTSQPQMSIGSPQVGNDPTQQSQKQVVPGQADVSKIDAARIDLLLELNKVLLQEVLQLQSIGRAPPAAGQSSDTQGGQQSPVSKDPTEVDGGKTSEDGAKKGATSSREYVECMYRLRGNIGWLTSLASRNTAKPQPIVERPPIMEPLSTNIEGNTISEESMNTIREMYKRMKELFPPTTTGVARQPGQTQNQTPQSMQPQQLQPQQQQQQQPSPQQQQNNVSAQQQAQSMQQQILMHQQQMAAQVGNMHGMSPAGMGRGQGMTPQQMQQQMMARAMANMQNQQNNFGQGM